MSSSSTQPSQLPPSSSQEQQHRQSKYMIAEGLVSTLANLLLFIFKYIVGVATGSISIIADAWHTLSDCISSGVIIIGAFYAKKPEDKKHPFGHGRIELVTNMVIAIMLVFIAYSFSIEAISKIVAKTHTTFDKTSIIIMVVSVVLKEALAQFSFWAGKKVDAMSLVSDGWHHRTDALSSIAILLGIFLNQYFYWADGVLALVVAVIIVITAARIIAETVSTIIGETPNDELISKIEAIACSIEGINCKSLHHFHIHRYGRHIEMTFHIRFDPQTTVYVAHEATSILERRLRNELNIESTIHIECIKECSL